MDLFLFIALSVTYLMVIHFAISIKNQFNLFLMIGIFVAAGVIGAFMNSYELALVGAVVLSLIFW